MKKDSVSLLVNVPDRWEAEHVEDLYKGINAAVLEPLDEYFVGSIVGIKSNGVTNIYDGGNRDSLQP